MQFFPFLALGGAGGGSAGGAGGLMSMAPFVLIIGIFYFFIIRPQNKKQKETQKMIDGAKKGDKVVTIGGIHGTVTSTEDKTVTVKVDENCRLKLNRSAIATVVSDKPVEDKADKKEKKESGKKAIEKKDSDKKDSEKSEKAEVKENEKKIEKDDKVNA
jgi:preprotein translocase subunit YajC